MQALLQQLTRAQLACTQIRTSATPPRLRHTLNAPGGPLRAAETRAVDFTASRRRGGCVDYPAARQGAELVGDVACMLRVVSAVRAAHELTVDGRAVSSSVSGSYARKHLRGRK